MLIKWVEICDIWSIFVKNPLGCHTRYSGRSEYSFTPRDKGCSSQTYLYYFKRAMAKNQFSNRNGIIKHLEGSIFSLSDLGSPSLRKDSLDYHFGKHKVSDLIVAISLMILDCGIKRLMPHLLKSVALIRFPQSSTTLFPFSVISHLHGSHMNSPVHHSFAFI